MVSTFQTAYCVIKKKKKKDKTGNDRQTTHLSRKGCLPLYILCAELSRCFATFYQDTRFFISGKLPIAYDDIQCLIKC